MLLQEVPRRATKLASVNWGEGFKKFFTAAMDAIHSSDHPVQVSSRMHGNPVKDRPRTAQDACHAINDGWMGLAKLPP